MRGLGLFRCVCSKTSCDEQNDDFAHDPFLLGSRNEGGFLLFLNVANLGNERE